MAMSNMHSFSGSLSNDALQTHIVRSYFVMRLGTAIVGAILPFVLLIGGLLNGICAQGSISAYYHAVGTSQGAWYVGILRTWFVGTLFSVSIILGLYRGYSRTEDRLLDVAAILGLGIAIFPMSWPPKGITCGFAGSVPYAGIGIGRIEAHAICAVGFFICIALVCWFCADDTLPLVKSPRRRKFLKIAYRVIALAMPTSMLVAAGLNLLLGTNRAVFWVEATGIEAFAVYWFMKGIELNATAADDKAAQGKLQLVAGTIQEVNE
jgi:hypothetical protein